MAEFFVRRPIVAMVLAIIILILGLVALSGLPVAQYPEITPPMVQVSGTYTGANAINVEQSVATPIEQKVNGVEDMIYMTSTNSSDGRMGLSVSFEVGTDLDMANVLTQNRVSEAQATLPEEVKRLGVTVKKQLSFPLLLISLVSPNGTYDESFLTNYASINLVDEVARIRGVGLAEVLGGSITEYAMRIWIKPDQLAKLNLTVPDIIGAIQTQNVLVPAGQIGGEPAPPGTEFTYTVNTGGRFETPEEFGNVVVRADPDGSQVLLRDVARIELGSQNYLYKVRLDGKPSALVQVFQLPDANGLDVADQVFTALDRIAENFPDDVEYVVSLDTTKPITAGIREIVVTLFQAVFLVILVVYIFLQSARATLIPTLTVPVSLIGAFAVFPLLGFSINTLSLLGLVLAIGIVVDDAIVVVEAVTAKMEKGMPAEEATIAAMREVSGPIVATSLALIAVFVPVATMGGITGALYQQFAITIAISVAISSINALTLSPALAASLLKPPGEDKSLFDKFFRWFNHWFEIATDKFMVLTGFFTHKIGRAALLLVILIAGIVLLFRILPAGFVPEEDQAYIMAGVIMPDGASLQRTDAVMKQVEEVIARYDAVQNATVIAGYSILSGTLQPNAGMAFIQLTDWDERSDEADHATAVVRRMNAEFAAIIKEGAAFAFGPPAIPGLGTGSGFTMMLQDRGGNSPDYLFEQASRFIEAAEKRVEIGSAITLFRPNSPQIFLDIDDGKALKLGVPLADVNSSVGAFLGGAYVNDFNRFGRLYKVYVQAEPEYRATIDGINMFYVRNNQGDPVPLSTLVETSRSAGPEFTNRFNLYRAAKITGQPAPGYSSAQAITALEEVAADILPGDMSVGWADMSYQEKEAAGSGGVVFLMALVFVFLILAAQYESWSLPLSVLAGTPIAVFGAVAGLWIARLFSESYVNNVFAQIGLVMLIGLAAKNAILIVEFAKVESEKGKTPVEAAMEAARLRFRPILMTAFSFILGVLPLLVASGAGAEARKVMGMTVFSGMLVATVIGVLVVPALYVLVERYIARRKPAPDTLEPQQASRPTAKDV
ncbi:MAG TPA: multidrug efflux RND transporter permease subunit [Halieaceae bacterium]|nr:MAG: hydrophobe/amphiphile efflux-1 family RND transporter [Gammaproteobacteria bacterium]HDY81413.1 multidrug efflux RND transporter permease subunit [Halieaceae bacterium]